MSNFKHFYLIEDTSGWPSQELSEQSLLFDLTICHCCYYEPCSCSIYINIIIYYSFCVKTGSDRLKPSQEIKGALQRWFWWSWYSCMSSLYGLFGEVSYSCTLPFSMLKKCKKKSMASSWYSAANHSLIHFLQDYLFATFSHIGVYFFCHCFYTHVQIQTSFNLCQKN